MTVALVLVGLALVAFERGYCLPCEPTLCATSPCNPQVGSSYCGCNEGGYGYDNSGIFGGYGTGYGTGYGRCFGRGSGGSYGRGFGGDYGRNYYDQDNRCANSAYEDQQLYNAGATNSQGNQYLDQGCYGANNMYNEFTDRNSMMNKDNSVYGYENCDQCTNFDSQNCQNAAERDIYAMKNKQAFQNRLLDRSCGRKNTYSETCDTDTTALDLTLRKDRTCKDILSRDEQWDNEICQENSDLVDQCVYDGTESQNGQCNFVDYGSDNRYTNTGTVCEDYDYLLQDTQSAVTENNIEQEDCLSSAQSDQCTNYVTDNSAIAQENCACSTDIEQQCGTI